MSIKLKDVRTRVARQFPSNFDACFAKCYTLREVDIVADAARVAVDRLKEKDYAIDAHVRRIQELESQVSKLVIASEKVVESHKRAGEGTVAPPSETKLYVKVTMPFVEGGLFGTPGINGIGIIKAIRAATDMGLKEAKDVYDAARAGHPQLVGPLPASKAADFARELAVCGGTGNITPTRA